MAGLTGRALIASAMCVNYLPEGVELWLESEIGIVGSAPTPSWDDVDPDLIDAGGQPAALIKGGSVADHLISFTYIRGGHIAVAVL